MKRFQKLLNEVKGEKAHKEAVAMGLKYKGFGYWVDPGTGETKFKTENDALVPVEGEVTSDMWKDPKGIGDQPMQGGAGGAMGAMQPGMMQPMQPQQQPGENILGAPESGYEQPQPTVGWEPGPDGDTCVDTDQPPGEVPTDSYVGRPNNLNWAAGPTGSNFTNVTFAQLKDIMEQLAEGTKTKKIKKQINIARDEVGKGPVDTAGARDIRDNRRGIDSAPPPKLPTPPRTGVATNIRRLKGETDIPMDTKHFPKFKARGEFEKLNSSEKEKELEGVNQVARGEYYPPGTFGAKEKEHYVSKAIDDIGNISDKKEALEAHNKALQGSGLFADPQFDLDQYDELFQGGQQIGDEGGSGTAVMTPDGASVIKDGQISKGEMDILHKLKGQTGFPMLLNGRINEPFNPDYPDAEVGGRFAMARARGVPFADAWDENEITDPDYAVQKIWELRKKLHTNGIAHNDMHGGNFFWDDENAQASIIDMGFATDNPIDAFQEALGGVTGGDYQFSADYINDSGNYPYGSPWNAGIPGNEKLQEKLQTNLERVKKRFADDHKINDDTDEVTRNRLNVLFNGGIRLRGKRDRLEGLWPKLKDNDYTMGLISDLYDGIEDKKDELQTRMGSAFDDRVQDAKRAAFTGRGLQGMPIVPRNALEHDD